MRGDIFNVGDLVRVRDWDDMDAEFGRCKHVKRNINCEGIFSEGMRGICGLEAEITKVIPNYDGRGYTVYETTSVSINCWVITADMLELVARAGCDEPAADFQLANPAGFLF